MKSPLFYLIVWVCICIGVVVGYGWWYTTIANKSLAVADLQSQIDAKTEASGRVATARATLADIAGDEIIVQSYFVPETGVVSFIDNLEKRARAQSATTKVLSVSVGGTPKKPTLILSLTVEGAFDAVMRTVGAIEYAPYNLLLSKLMLGKEEKGSWRATIEIVVGSVPASTATTTATKTATVSYIL